MEVLKVSIQKEKKQFWLYVNGIRHDAYFSHNERVRLLELANKSFDNDLNAVANSFKNHKHGAYLWVYTSEFIRGEAISSVQRWCFIKEMLKDLSSKQNIIQAEIATRTPESIIHFLKKNDFNINYNAYNYAKWNLLYCGRTTLIFFKSLRKNIAFIYKKRNYPHKGVIVDINRSFTKHRYDSIESVIEKYPDIKFFSGQEHPLENIAEKDAIVFRKELSWRILFSSLKKAINLSLFVLRNKKQIPNPLYDNYSDIFNFLLWYDLIIFQKCIAKYLDNNRIEKIFHVSTLTKPTYRSLMAEAKKRNIEFTIVASRTLMHYRCSERLLNCDVSEYNKTALPERYIFKDEYSKKVFDAYPEVKNKINVGGRFISNKQNDIKENNPTALLLLFNHTKALFYRQLNEVIKIKVSNLVDTIIFRCHPAFVLNKSEMQEYFPENYLIDITGKDYTAIKNYRTITISGATTGALDAVQAGTVILWVPYTWDDGIMMDDIMQNLGVKNENRQELKMNTERFVEDKLLTKEQFEKDKEFLAKNFNTSNLISDCL